tara:strand:- start:80 stop:1108 length:1029 start_codon:yes stop_codon:yes gene_type:complete
MGQKFATTRYHVLDQCFSNPGKKHSISDIVEKINNALVEENLSIQKRQVYDDIKFMESENGYSVELEKEKIGRTVYYRYKDSSFSIKNQPLNESEKIQFKEAINSLQRFKGLPQFEWVDDMAQRLESTIDLGYNMSSIIEYEYNPDLKGYQFIKNIYEAIVNKVVLKILYKPYGKDEQKFNLSPYYLKQYNNRWFLFGKDSRFSSISNLPLDRIQSIEHTVDQFEKNPVDFEGKKDYGYFDDILGVTIPKDSKIEDIVLRIDKTAWPYIESKPFPSQQNKFEKDGDYFLVKLKLIPNNELESKILEWGEHIEVIKPDFLRNKLRERAKKLLDNYNSADTMHT